MNKNKRPIQPTHEVRWQVIKRKSKNGIEYTKYKVIILKIKND